MAMKIAKKEIDLFFLILKESEVSLADGRLRDSVVKQLVEPSQEYAKEKQAVIEKFCTKDEEGKPLLTTNEKGEQVYSFPTESVEDANKEFAVLLEEEIEINVSDPARLKTIAENTKYSPKIGEAELVDKIIAKII